MQAAEPERAFDLTVRETHWRLFWDAVFFLILLYLAIATKSIIAAAIATIALAAGLALLRTDKSKTRLRAVLGQLPSIALFGTFAIYSDGFGRVFFGILSVSGVQVYFHQLGRLRFTRTI
jgi:hypothetical protein